jgi:hypothetical protein
MDGSRNHAWMGYDELSRLQMPDANRQMLRALRWRIGAVR